MYVDESTRSLVCCRHVVRTQEGCHKENSSFGLLSHLVFMGRMCLPQKDRTQRIAVFLNGNADVSASTKGFHPKYDYADTNMNVP